MENVKSSASSSISLKSNKFHNKLQMSSKNEIKKLYGLVKEWGMTSQGSNLK